MIVSALILYTSLLSLFAAVPASPNFTLNNYDFGSGGITGSSSSYNLNGTVGTQTGSTQANGVTVLNPGEKSTQNANVPPAAALTNPNNSYNSLHLIINTGSNPTDSRFAIAISSDNFTTTQYIKTDSSLGSTLAIGNYQSYAQWGSASGFDVLGLNANTSYKVKVSAYQGAFTASAFGPTSAAVATQATTVSFTVATTTKTTPPFNVSFTSLTAGTVFSADANAQLTLSTNAAFGGGIYIVDKNGGLKSAKAGYTLNSATADLAAASSGYGAQVTSLSQANGGPLSALNPFNGVTNNVGGLTTSLQQIIGLGTAVTNGSAQIKFMAKTAYSTPGANDYSDTQTIIAAMAF
jgi:hypothetical protein